MGVLENLTAMPTLYTFVSTFQIGNTTVGLQLKHIFRIFSKPEVLIISQQDSAMSPRLVSVFPNTTQTTKCILNPIKMKDKGDPELNGEFLNGFVNMS